MKLKGFMNLTFKLFNNGLIFFLTP